MTQEDTIKLKVNENTTVKTAGEFWLNLDLSHTLEVHIFPNRHRRETEAAVSL